MLRATKPIAPANGNNTRSRFRGPMESPVASAAMTATGALELDTDNNNDNDGENHHAAAAAQVDERISIFSNFSIQYNLCVIAPALLLLDHTRGE